MGPLVPLPSPQEENEMSLHIWFDHDVDNNGGIIEKHKTGSEIRLIRYNPSAAAGQHLHADAV